MKTKLKKLHLPDLIGAGYRLFWYFTGRYRALKGSRASKKSKTTALWYIFFTMLLPGSNTVVVRKIYRTLRDSCFADLKWAIHRLGVDHLWSAKENPLELTYIPTGQKILFRGLDDPQLSSIPIVAMTANAFASDIEAVLKAGMNAHLAKPFLPEELVAAVSRNLP